MMIESPDNFLDDFGIPCSNGAVRFTGLLDMPDQTFDLGGSSIQSSEYNLIFRTSDLTIANGDVLTVAGVAYTARGPANKLDDGVFSAIKMSRQ